MYVQEKLRVSLILRRWIVITRHIYIFGFKPEQEKDTSSSKVYLNTDSIFSFKYCWKTLILRRDQLVKTTPFLMSSVKINLFLFALISECRQVLSWRMDGFAFTIRRVLLKKQYLHTKQRPRVRLACDFIPTMSYSLTQWWVISF